MKNPALAQICSKGKEALAYLCQWKEFLKIRELDTLIV